MKAVVGPSRDDSSGDSEDYSDGDSEDDSDDSEAGDDDVWGTRETLDIELSDHVQYDEEEDMPMDGCDVDPDDEHDDYNAKIRRDNMRRARFDSESYANEGAGDAHVDGDVGSESRVPGGGDVEAVGPSSVNDSIRDNRDDLTPTLMQQWGLELSRPPTPVSVASPRTPYQDLRRFGFDNSRTATPVSMAGSPLLRTGPESASDGSEYSGDEDVMEPPPPGSKRLRSKPASRFEPKRPRR